MTSVWRYKLFRSVLVLGIAFAIGGIGFFVAVLTADGVLSAVGAPPGIADPLTLLAGLGWMGLVAVVAWPPWPTTLGAIARTRGFETGIGGKGRTDDVAAAIEHLAGMNASEPSGLDRVVKPQMKEDTARRIGGAVYNATVTPERRQDVLDAVDADPAEVVERLLVLYDRFDRTNMKFLLIGIERFARDGPRGVEGYVAELFEVLETDHDMAVRHAALAVGHLGRESPAAVEGAVERLRPHVTNGDPLPEVLTALGELAAHDAEARRVLAEVTSDQLEDPSNETVFGVLVEINTHYAETDDPERDPYPAPDALDRQERENHERERKQKVRQALRSAIMDGESGGDGFEGATGDYHCENCGATLRYSWDYEGGHITDAKCGNCGYVLDEQFWAGLALEESLEEGW